MEEISNHHLEQVPDSVLLDPGLALRTPVPPESRSEKPEIKLLCVRCWSTFEGLSRQTCPRCSVERPFKGWATMPYSFRDRYLFWRLLGRGGMGAVFLAYDEHQIDDAKKTVAIKVVPQTSSPSAQLALKRMFEREAAAAAMLAQSPHFVRVIAHDVGVEPAHLVMEYVDWPTLRGLLRRGQGKVRALSPVKVARIGVALLRGLSTMHFHRIVHRDLKPDNIFVRRASQGDEYDIKILDLGVWTKDSLSQHAQHSLPGFGENEASPVGTFSYMSPEQLASRPVGSASDIHTVGSVLWELATGRVPFPMPKKELAPAMRERMEKMKTPPARPEGMPEGLHEILVKALSFEPRDRWESAEEMKSALKVWVAEELLRTQAAVGEAVKRLGELEKQVQKLCEPLLPGAPIVEQLKEFAERVSTLRGHAEEASPIALARSVAEAEDVHKRLSEEIARYIKSVERGIAENGAASVTSDIEPPQQLQKKAKKGRRSLLQSHLADRVAVSILTFSVAIGGVYLLGLDADSGAKLGAAASAMRDKSASLLGLTPDPKLAAIDRPAMEPKLIGPSEKDADSPLAGLTSREYADALLGTGHGGGYVSVAFSPVAPILASGSADSTVRLYRTDSGEYLGKLLGNEGAVFETAFSPDGKLIATAAEDGRVRLFELASKRLVASIKAHKSVVRSVAFSPDGQLVASGGEDGAIRVWSIATGEEARRMKYRAKRKNFSVRSIAFAPGGERLAAAGSDGDVIVFDALKGDELASFRAHEGGVYGVAYLGDGRIVTGGFDRDIRVWSAETRLLLVLKGHQNQVRSVVTSQDGKWIASASFDRTVRVWRADDGQLMHTLEGHQAPAYQVAFSPQGDLLASGGHDKAVRLWRTEDGRAIREHTGREGLVLAVAADPTGKLLASAGHDATVRVFEADTGALVATLEGHKGWVQSIAFSSDGKRLVSGSHDRTVRVWSVRDGVLLNSIDAHDSWVRAVAFSPDGQTIASCSDDRTIKLWDANSAAERLRLRGHKSDVRAIAFSPDGKVIASASDDRTIRLWSTNTGELGKVISGAGAPLRSIAFSPDGMLVAAGGDDRVLRIYDTRSSELVRAHEGHEGSIRSVSFAPDGKAVASAGLDRTIKIWSVGAPELLASLDGHELGVESIAFTRRGDRILSGGSDSTRRLWDWPTGAWMSMGMGPTGWVVFDDRGRVERWPTETHAAGEIRTETVVRP